MCGNGYELLNKKKIIDNKKPLWICIVLIILMCAIGSAVSIFKINIEWAKITLCILWLMLCLFASFNQGYLYHRPWTMVLDISCAVSITIIYGIIYYCNFLWWHILSVSIAFLLFGIWCILDLAGLCKNMSVNTYIFIVSIWHFWVIFQVISVSYTIETCGTL